MPLPNRARLRVPPDGAGKALAIGHVFYIRYTGSADPIPFSVGDTVIGSSSSLIGEVVYVAPQTATTGRVSVSIGFEDLQQEFQTGESLLVDGDFRATVSESESLFLSRTQLVGANNPNLGQHVDVMGAASVRFAEGAPNLDASGRTEVSNRSVIAAYSPTYDALDSMVTVETNAGGAQTYDSSSETIVLSTPTTNGAFVRRTTNLYHKYQAGVSQVVEMTVTPGTPKPNLIKRWGYFDDHNGMFFECSGETLYAVLRSSVTGSVVERKVPMSEWNGDRLDGTGNMNSNPSAEQMDPNNMYLFGFNFLYLGAGKVRFTIATGGRRVTVHSFDGGDGAFPYMSTATLPLRWEVVNDGTVASTSELRIGNAAVSCEASFTPMRTLQGSGVLPAFPVTGSEYLTPFLVRATQTLKGKPNRGIAIPTRISIFSTTEPLYLRILEDGNYNEITTWYKGVPPQDILLEAALRLSDPEDPSSALPIFNVPEASGFPSGNNRYAQLIPANEVVDIDLTEIFTPETNAILHRKADINADPSTFGIVVNSLTGASTTVHMAASWYEVL